MDSFQQARDALQRIEAARRAEAEARREQQEAWRQLEAALAELRSSSSSIQAMPMEALLQSDLGAPDSDQVVSAPSVVARSNDGARGDGDSLPQGLDDAEPVLDEWTFPPELQHPVDGEGADGDAAWAELLEEDLGDEQDVVPFPQE